MDEAASQRIGQTGILLRAIGPRPTKTRQTHLHFRQEAKIKALALLVQGKEQSQFVLT